MHRIPSRLALGHLVDGKPFAISLSFTIDPELDILESGGPELDVSEFLSQLFNIGLRNANRNCFDRCPATAP